MNWRTVTTTFVVGLVCFGVGRFSGSVVFHKAGTNAANRSATTDTPASVSPSSELNSSTSYNGTSTSAMSYAAGATNLVAKGQSTIADLKAALRATRSRWDFGKIYHVLDNLDTNQFPEAINLCLKT